MDIDIVDEDSNPMLHRTDVTFELSHADATPSRLQVRDSLAASLNKEAEEVVVRKLDAKFGMRKTVGTAKVYDSPGYASDIEQAHMLERNKIADGEAEPAPDPTVDEETEPETETDEEEPDADDDAEPTDAEPDEEKPDADDDTEPADAEPDEEEPDADDDTEPADAEPDEDEAEDEE